VEAYPPRGVRRFLHEPVVALGAGVGVQSTVRPNGRSEATNTHIRALTKRAYGYHSPEALIGMAMLTRGGLCPPLAPYQGETDPRKRQEILPVHPSLARRA